jgi:hypothetical protein
MVGLTITGYEYALATSADSYATYGSYITSSWTSGTSFTISGLTNGTLYKVKIRAVNPLGSGAESGLSDPFKPYTTATVTTTTGSDATTTPTATTTNAPSALQTFSTTQPRVTRSVAGSQTWDNPYPSGATTGTGTLNGSAGTTHFVWGTSSGSYPNEVAATGNSYVRTTWPRGTTVYYKARVYNTSCTVTFNGTVNSNGANTTVTFEYGTSSGVYPSSVSAGTVTALTATAVTATVSSLAAGTYYYRVKAVNAAGTTYGTQQSIAISAKSATAASEQSFTPPAVTQIQNILVVGGGGGRGFYALNGGGGGGITHKATASVGSSVAIITGGGATGYNSTGDYSQLVCTGATMTAYGGTSYTDNPYPTADRAGSSGSASGGDTNYASSQGGISYEYWNENTTAGGGGGGASGAGGDISLCNNNPTNPYSYGYADVGGNGSSHVNIFGFLVGGGGGGASDYGTEGAGPCVINGADGGGTYGKGARAYVTGTRGSGSGEPNIVYNDPPSSMSGTDGIVTFEWVGPA